MSSSASPSRSALANAPRVLFADEPTGELDTATSHDVLEALRTVNRELGTTVVVVTHDPGVSEHVQRTVSIRDGRTQLGGACAARTPARTAPSTWSPRSSRCSTAPGRVQLPREYRETLDLVGRVRLTLEQSHVSLWPDRRAGRDADGRPAQQRPARTAARARRPPPRTAAHDRTTTATAAGPPVRRHGAVVRVEHVEPHVRLRTAAVHALRDVSLEVAPG